MPENTTRKRRNITISREMEEYARDIAYKLIGKRELSAGIENALREKRERENKNGKAE